ncbi:MAG: GNAT family N-acetyltransferase [Crocinitomix sp.]|nr:GNAT family N-acetyltransferase [Crocinitomix sp.]
MDYKRVLTAEEIKTISELAYLLFPLDYGAYVRKNHINYFLEKYQSEEAIAEQIENGYEYFLLSEKGEVSGYFGFEIMGERLKLSKLYFLVNVRNRGLGHQAMTWLKEYAIEKGCKQLELSVLLENKKAIRFYERLGYRTAGIYEVQFKTGYSETNYRMEQSI